MLYRSVASACGGALSLVLGTRVEVVARPPVRAPNEGWIEAFPSFATARFGNFSVRANDAGGLLPFAAASLDSEGGVQLGWKMTALLFAPLWLFVAPTLLPGLVLLWALLPKGPTSGALNFELLLRSSDLNRRRTLWRWLLGGVLSGIAQNSLPAMLASINLQGPSASAAVTIPSSRCLSAAIASGRLVLDGRVEFATMEGPAIADYTVRMAVKPQPRDAPGVLRADGRASLGSCVLWDAPEMRVSLGERGLARLLPKLWVPIASATGIELPYCVDLRRAGASDAADALVFAGAIELDVSSQVATSTGGPPRAPQDEPGAREDRGADDRRWTDAERDALRLPPSEQ